LPVITSFLFGLEKLIISKFIQKFILTATTYIKLKFFIKLTKKCDALRHVK